MKREDVRADETFGRPAHRARERDAQIPAGKARLPWPVALFLVGLVVPWIIPLGPMNLSVYRIVLLVTLPFCLFSWGNRVGGAIRTADIAVLLFCLWASLSLALVHGIAPMIDTIGILNVETLGAYFLARCYIRGAEDFRNMCQFASGLVVVLLPFSLYEWITGQKPLLIIASFFFPTFDLGLNEARLGFRRVQGPFDHPIVYGLFCGSLFALTYFTSGRGKGPLARWSRLTAMALAGFLSMSSAPIAGMALQFALIAWNALLLGFSWRWKAVWIIVFMGYLAVEFGSSQTPVQFYISHFTFDAQTGWYRLLIWNYGTATVVNHPFFGIGLGDWARATGMNFSVDNFWLLITMRHGIPAFILIFGACLMTICGIGFKRQLDPEVDAYRTGYVICLIMFLMVGCTVHFWSAIYSWFFFLLGSGAWMLEVKSDNISVTSRSSCAGNGRGRDLGQGVQGEARANSRRARQC